MQRYSWNKLSDTKIVKTLDYSSFNEKSSGIPKDFYAFFNIEGKSDIQLTLNNGNNNFYAKISWKQPNYSRAVINWENDFSTLLKQKFPTWNTVKPHNKNSQMGLVFNQTDKNNVYKISFKNTTSEMLYGRIDNIREGHLFESRDELRLSGIHGEIQAGIWGRNNQAASSIVLSGGYSDDKDNWNTIVYTGQGGQENGKQVKDQEFTLGNRGLQLNKEYNLPVRVTRGFQIANGPDKGYRYDGLYYVTDFERVEGKDKYLICRFYLEKENSKSLEDLNFDLNDESSQTAPDRIPFNGNRIKRNVQLSETIKEIYNYKCQVCNIFLKVPTSDEKGIANGSHIKALGYPHNGPDVLSNLLCLCPNHHAQFDNYSFYINPDNFEIIGLDGYKGKLIISNQKHKIKVEYFEYHKQQYLKKTLKS